MFYYYYFQLYNIVQFHHLLPGRFPLQKGYRILQLLSHHGLAFQAYRNRTDNHGVMCSACHGSTHAIYGAYNKYGLQRDNQQALQYQGLAGTIGTHGQCMVCHTVEMTTNGHHRNMVNREVPALLVE